MNICLVSQEYPPETAHGGIGTQTWNKAQALTRLGHTVHVLSTSTKVGEDLRTVVEAGVTVHRLRPPGFEFPVYEESTFWVGYSWAVLRQLRRLMERVSFDLVNFPEYGGEGFAFQLDRTRWNWVPVVVQLHGPLAMFSEKLGWPAVGSEFHRVGTLMERVSIQQADGLMASSANIADFVAAYYGVARDTIDVVHCGIDCDLFRPAAEAERDEGRPTVLFVGNLTADKGINTVFEAALRLRAQHPRLRLQVLGKGEETLVKNFQERARAQGAADLVEYGGFVSDRRQLPEYYRRAQVFASPAHHEVGVANVYVEAMACGCPVVACQTGGAPEAVRDGETGLLVPPSDVEATTRVLGRLLGDAALRRRMGEAGRRRAEEYFAVDHYIARVLAAYQRTLERSRQKLERLQQDSPEPS